MRSTDLRGVIQRTRHLGEPARRLFVVVGALLALVVAMPGGAQAQDAGGNGPAPEKKDEAARSSPRHRSAGWLPRVRLDNDAYNFWLHPGHRSDEEYTNGVVLGMETLRAPAWGGVLGGGAPACLNAQPGDRACLSTLLFIGQDMYTPNLDRPPFSYIGWEFERPYAAWLYVGGEGRRVSSRALRTYALSLGVTGAPALGKLAQAVAHEISARYTTKATGWETQVGFEPGVLLGLRQTVLALRWAPGGVGVLDLAPSVGGTLGNIRTAADMGGKLRLGINLSHPWDPRAWRARADWEFNVSAAGRREYVAHDFSLDGTLLRTPDRQVTRVPTVNEYEFGTALRIRRLTVGWRAITRSKEYTTGPARHAFSQMYSAIEFRP
ncbi:MAG: lipid A deacylase LpxR family protein [Gemmatimonadetes bacterium]|nr:lipid A deacylase LpxR family protein [Gemmatimonadota bacterium]